MLKYISKRLGLLVATLIIIFIIVFFLLQLMPGYPKAIETQIQGLHDKDKIDAVLASLHQSDGVFTKFANYVSGIFHGNFGTYYKVPTETIPTLYFKPFKTTLLITGPAFLIGTFLGLMFGFIAGYKRGKWPDVVVNIISIFFIAVPSFVLATFFALFARKLGIPVNFKESTADLWLKMVLPVTIVSITSFSTLTYYIRNEVVEILTSDFIAIARAKGVSEKQIFFKHVLRNVSIPLVTIVLPSFIAIIMGSMIIEMFFFVPGSASIFAMAITNKEIYVVMFTTIFFTSLGLLVQLLVDIIYVLLDPRIKLAASNGKSFRKLFAAKKARKLELEANMEVKND